MTRWEDAHRASCARCGGLRGGGTTRADGSRRAVKGDLCAACRTADSTDRTLEMWRLRTLGLLNHEIAEQLGTTSSTVATQIKALRALGFDVAKSPYKGGTMPRRATLTLTADIVAPGRTLAARGITPDNPPEWARTEAAR